MEFKNVGVIGAGTMGRGVTEDLVLHGINTVLIDQSEEILNEARADILKTIRLAPLLKPSVPRLSEEEVLAKITFSTDLNALKDCDFIVENVTEDIQIKKEVYEQIDQICAPEVCFAVDTSCISITKIAGYTSRPEQVIGMHFMNPVFMKSSIEVIRGYHTSEETIGLAKEFMAQLEKDPIIVNDYPGFVANRISHLFMNEAAFVVQDGVATPSQVDDIFKKCYGHKMGPLATADLIGLDTVVKSLEVLYQEYQDPKFKCCPLLRKMVDAGLLGRKSGKGFFEYSK